MKNLAWWMGGGLLGLFALTKSAKADEEKEGRTSGRAVYENTYAVLVDAHPTDQGLRIVADELDPGFIRRVDQKWDGYRKHTHVIRSFEPAEVGARYYRTLRAGDFMGERAVIRVVNVKRVA